MKPTEVQKDGAKVKVIMLGGVVCSLPDSNAVYDNRGGKSTKAIVASVTIPDLGMKIEATIYSRLTVKSDGTEIVTECSKPKGISFESDEDRDRLLGHVERAAMVWTGYDAAVNSAERRLLGQKQKHETVEARPRLVKAVKATAESAA